MKAAQITDPITFHGEGPVWSKSWGGLRWLDMLAGDILSLAETGEVKRKNVGSKIAACVRLRPARAERSSASNAALRLMPMTAA